MNRNGLLMDFIFCKIGVALAAISLIGASMAMSSSFERWAGRDELAMVGDTIARAIFMADAIPGEVQLARELPSLRQQFKVTIVGVRSDAVQVVHILVDGRSQDGRVIMVRNKVNGGEFELSYSNPSVVRVGKNDRIYLELV